MKKAAKWVVGVAKAAPGAPQTEGLTPLDQDRAASLADEGGASAASVEAQPAPSPTTLPAPPPVEEVADLDETPPLGFWPREKAK